MGNEILTKERTKYIKEYLKLLEPTNYAPNENEVEKLKNFTRYLTYDYTSRNLFALWELFNEDLNIAINLLDTIKDFAIENKIPYHTVFSGLKVFSVIQLTNLNNYFIQEEKENLDLSRNKPEDITNFLKDMLGTLELRKNVRETIKSENDFYSAISLQYSRVCTYANNLPYNYNNIDPLIFQEVLDNSYEEVKKNVFQNLKSTELPLD